MTFLGVLEAEILKIPYFIGPFWNIVITEAVRNICNGSVGIFVRSYVCLDTKITFLGVLAAEISKILNFGQPF
jgi:hypothetical protein